MKVAIAILASGFSSRYGSNKLISKLGGTPLLLYAVSNAMGSSADAVSVVTAPGDIEINEFLPHGTAIIENSSRKEGMSSSVKTAVRALKNYDGILFLAGDQPFVTSNTLNMMMDAFRNNGCRIVSCELDGRVVNPMLFHMCFYEEIERIEGDRGAKSVAVQHSDDICAITAGEDELFDVDTAQDMKKAECTLRNNPSLVFRKTEK